jgi:hypothetical protein
MHLAWRDDPAYLAAFAGTDVVIFDSTRSHTAALGLTEDASDDWAAFTSSLLDPFLHGRGGFRTCDLSRVKRALSH